MELRNAPPRLENLSLAKILRFVANLRGYFENVAKKASGHT